MIRVTIELYPGGGVIGRKVLGELNIANIGEPAYEAWLEGPAENVTVKFSHDRTVSAWWLVRSALNALAGVHALPSHWM